MKLTAYRLKKYTFFQNILAISTQYFLLQEKGIENEIRQALMLLVE